MKAKPWLGVEEVEAGSGPACRRALLIFALGSVRLGPASGRRRSSARRRSGRSRGRWPALNGSANATQPWSGSRNSTLSRLAGTSPWRRCAGGFTSRQRRAAVGGQRGGAGRRRPSRARIDQAGRSDVGGRGRRWAGCGWSRRWRRRLRGRRAGRDRGDRAGTGLGRRRDRRIDDRGQRRLGRTDRRAVSRRSGRPPPQPAGWPASRRVPGRAGTRPPAAPGGGAASSSERTRPDGAAGSCRAWKALRMS